MLRDAGVFKCQIKRMIGVDGGTLHLEEIMIHLEAAMPYAVNKPWEKCRWEMIVRSSVNKKRRRDLGCDETPPGYMTVKPGVQVRDFQEHAANKMFELYHTMENGRPKNEGGILKMCCGAGKTFCAVYGACIKIAGVDVTIIVNRPALAEQWYDEITKFFDFDPGVVVIFGAQRETTVAQLTAARVIITTPPMMLSNKRIDTWQCFAHRAAILLLDEVHGHANHNWYARATERARSVGVMRTMVVGLTGALYREDKDEGRVCLGQEVGPVFFDVGYAKVAQVNLHVQMCEMKQSDTHVYKIGAIMMVLAAAAAAGRQVIIFFDRLELLAEYAKLLQDQDVEIVRGANSSDIHRILKTMQSVGQGTPDHLATVLLATKCCDTGIDTYTVSMVLHVHVRESARQSAIQRAGRGLRSNDSGPECGCTVVYFVDPLEMHRAQRCVDAITETYGTNSNSVLPDKPSDSDLVVESLSPAEHLKRAKQFAVACASDENTRQYRAYTRTVAWLERLVEEDRLPVEERVGFTDNSLKARDNFAESEGE